MSDSSQRPCCRGDNYEAPTKAPSKLYPYEKGKFAGGLSGAALYGIVIVLFFWCMCALFNPTNPTGKSIKRLLVAHTVAMFSFVTVFTALNLHFLSISYIDNREFPGILNGVPPGPLGYQYYIYNQAAGIISTVMFLLNNWLADGLLLYRCYIIYATNRWAIAFPCLIYFATIAVGTVLVYQSISHPSVPIWRTSAINIGVTYSVSVSLDVLLTIMIVARLLLLNREIRKAMNAPLRSSGVYRAVIAVISESSALYVVTFVLFIGTWAVDDPSEYFFFPVLAQAQVIAPFLIVLRVANRREVSNEIASGSMGSIRPRLRESLGSSGHSVTSTGKGGRNPEELSAEAIEMVDLRHDKI